MKFASDFSVAERPDGQRVTFTRSEKQTLKLLLENPNKVLTRDRILDVLSGQGSSKNDRNIDFIINRLRRKLDDDARNPRHIETRYGEGYVWIDSANASGADLADAFVVVGPLRGLENLPEDQDLFGLFVSELGEALRAGLRPDQKVVVAPDFQQAGHLSTAMPRLSVELSFFADRGTINCVTTARDTPSGRILALSRISLPDNDPKAVKQLAGETATALLHNRWHAMVTETETGISLPVLMYLPSTGEEPDHGTPADSDNRLAVINTNLENQTIGAWQENEARLRDLMQDSPKDAGLKILCATHIHSKYVSFGHRLFATGVDDRVADEARIEELVLDALPEVQSKPEFAIMAAKLLHFVDRGYFDLARTLSEDALRVSVAPVGSLAIVGQLRAFAGETEAALACLEQAANLAPTGSKQHLYALTLKLQALRSIADFERLNTAKQELYSIARSAALFFELMMADPDNLSLRSRALTFTLSSRKAMALLQMSNYISARLFLHPDHKANSILTPLTLMVRRFGTANLPPEITEAHSGLVERLNQASPVP